MISCYRFFALLIIQYLAHITYSKPSVKFFRKDYEYLEAPQAFYKFHTLEKSWDDAKLQCEMEGARLFYPDDEDEATAILELWKTQNFSLIFIGVSTPNSPRVFETVDGVPLSEVYNKWGPGEPNNRDGVEGCVDMRRDGTLNDDNCERKFPFMCKKTLSSLQSNNNYNIPDTDSQPNVKFFRRDYQYLEATQAFYKIHTLHKSWDDAKWKCEMEGALLFYPDDEEETTAVLDFWNKTQPFSMVFIGVSTPNVKEVFETVDGDPISEVYTNWGPGEPNDATGVEDCVVMRRDGTLNDDNCKNKFPFICKKTLSSLQWNNYCNIPDTAYEFNEDKGRCYKFHLNPMNWTEAYKVCDSEQSYLAVINDAKEAAFLANLTSRAPKDDVEGDFLPGSVYLGFKNTNRRWKTIRGTTLRKSGYSKWGVGQPDGGENEKCGSMFYNGELNDVSCGMKLFFICEHEIDILSNDFIRFGHRVKLYGFGQVSQTDKPEIA